MKNSQAALAEALEEQNELLKIALIRRTTRQNARLRHKAMTALIDAKSAASAKPGGKNRVLRSNPSPAQAIRPKATNHAGPRQTNPTNQARSDLAARTFPAAPGPALTFLQAFQLTPQFKAFARRGKSWPKPMTMAERLAANRKKIQAEIRAFMRPKGKWSILKDGPYTTGRYLKVTRVLTEEEIKAGSEAYVNYEEEKARFIRTKEGFDSEIESYPDNYIVEVANQFEEKEI